MIYATKTFWVGALERGIKTGAQFVLALLGIGVTAVGMQGETAEIISAFTLDWLSIGGAFLGGVFMSLMTSLVSPNPVPATAETSPLIQEGYRGRHAK